MSSFLGEYGKVIVVIIVIAALIVLGMVFKSSGSRYANWNFGKFMDIGDEQVEEAEEMNEESLGDH